MSYAADSAVKAPTLVVVPKTGLYVHGYCASVAGGEIVSKPGSVTLEVANEDDPNVKIHVSPGSCS
jgi:hypothetical protein